MAPRRQPVADPSVRRATPDGEWRRRPGLFQGRDPRDRAAIIAAARCQRVARHGFFFRQGTPASALHVLTDGQTKLVQTAPEGHRVVELRAGLRELAR